MGVCPDGGDEGDDDDDVCVAGLEEQEHKNINNMKNKRPRRVIMFQIWLVKYRFFYITSL